MNYQRVLVFGAHPDDEIAMAGTMAKLADQGCEVHVCISTDGSEGYPKPEWRDQIVALRKQEQHDCDQVLGVARRHHIDAPDMGLTNDKATFRAFIRVIREVRPEAIFTHGPHDTHRDHLNTHAISIEAAWQAGQPVSADLGEPWATRHVFYYKAVADQRACFMVNVTGYAHKPAEARATQVSQHVLFNRDREQFLAEAEAIQQSPGPYFERFWPTERMVFHDLPPREL